MPRTSIPIDQFMIKPIDQFNNCWFVLTAGDFSTGKFNSMTISWGSIGYLWGKPILHVVVRPTRYTYQFMESYDTFTICSFGEKYREALNLLGTLSGRDGNKIGESHLSPIVSTMVAAPGYEEADLIVECRKIYWGDLDPTHFLANGIDQHYEKKDYHRFYIGEILQIQGEERFRCED